MDPTKEKLSLLKNRFKGKKLLETLIVIVIIAVVVSIYISSIKPPPSANSEETSVITNMEPDDETRLEAILSNIKGAGAVEVMITYETTPEIVPAFDENTQLNSTEEQTQSGGRKTSNETNSSNAVTRQNGNVQEPVVLTQKLPKARGVVVVAEGAEDMKVRMDLQNAVFAVMDVPLNKIEVFIMKDLDKGVE